MEFLILFNFAKEKTFFAISELHQLGLQSLKLVGRSSEKDYLKTMEFVSLPSQYTIGIKPVSDVLCTDRTSRGLLIMGATFSTN